MLSPPLTATCEALPSRVESPTATRRLLPFVAVAARPSPALPLICVPVSSTIPVAASASISTPSRLLLNVPVSTATSTKPLSTSKLAPRVKPSAERSSPRMTSESPSVAKSKPVPLPPSAPAVIAMSVKRALMPLPVVPATRPLRTLSIRRSFRFRFRFRSPPVRRTPSPRPTPLMLTSSMTRFRLLSVVRSTPAFSPNALNCESTIDTLPIALFTSRP